MRLTNKQLQIVVEEVYNKVSLPIIESNNKLIESIELPIDQYLIDCNEVEKLQAKIVKLNKEAEVLKNKYYEKKYNGFKFNWMPMDNKTSYVKFQKEKLSKPKHYLNEREIEKQVILAGNRDIPTLIEELIIKLSK